METKLVVLVVCCITLAIVVDGVPSSDELGNEECNDLCKSRKNFKDKTNDICLLPKFVGRGKAAFPRFYFNSKKNKCEKFTFGGGLGNANNFQTKEECEKMCSKRDENMAEHAVASSKNAKRKNTICLLPKMVGRGKAAFPRFFFNVMTEKCEKFIFGGGLGNENNFETKDECEEKCVNAEKDPQFSQPTRQPTSQPTRQPLSTQTTNQQQYTQTPSSQSPASQSQSGQAQSGQSPSMQAPSKDKEKIDRL
uniref:PsP1 protein n=1 Tax=Phyllodiscus semoni TaxID=163701 RepID=L8AX18_PHYSE|nr:PsP1 [Phyllodiscus semoni]